MTPTVRTAARQSPDRLAEFLQHPLAQIHAVADAALGELDHLPGDGVGFGAVAVVQAERAADVGVGAGQHGERFRLKRLVAKQAVDGHRSALITVTDPDKADRKVAGGSAAVTGDPGNRRPRLKRELLSRCRTRYRRYAVPPYFVL